MVIECRMPSGSEDPFCRSCGARGQVCGTVLGHLAHVPAGRRSTKLVEHGGRLACTHFRRVRIRDTGRVAEAKQILIQAPTASAVCRCLRLLSTCSAALG